MSNTSAVQRSLFPVGLVLVGLLSGILLTLWFDGGVRGEDGGPLNARVVELGGPAMLPPVVVPESLASRGFANALTLNEAFKAVSSQVTPSVVFIEVVSGDRNLFHRFGGQGGMAISAGSGVVMSSDGYVVTNHHVIEGAEKITVTMMDKREFVADVVGDDPFTDLAVIRLRDAEDLPAIALSRGPSLEVGEWVLAIGNPFRLTSTVTAGIVSALGRSVNIINDQMAIENFIQTDAAINPGNSGGALVNLRGELVGIATAIATETGSNEGYGFAVPVDLMRRVVKDLIEFGEVKRGYLGVSIEPVNAARAREIGMTAVNGVFLGNVRRGMAAWDAGIRTGDVLLAIEGNVIDEPNELQGAIALYRPGDRIQVDIFRAGENRTFTVELFGRDDDRARDWFAEIDSRNGMQPAPEIPESIPHGTVRTIEGWGLGLLDISERISSVFGVERGAYIMFVENDTPTDRGGLPRNTIISALNGQEVETVDDVISVLEPAAERGRSVLFKVLRRDGSAGFFEVDAPE